MDLKLLYGEQLMLATADLPVLKDLAQRAEVPTSKDGTDGFFVALFQRRPKDVGGSGAAAVTGGGQPDRPLDGTADFTTSSQAAEEAKERGSTKRRGAVRM
ncbi:hypothetical protein HaLaN_21800 [Haematococcus lacustris]|uniref:Uncharacterized protein n=1 Tax=Haematococcus lacustris TaxID=44745 RepID=A0A699ZML5_HAELA|nr:hypothetical protein HaLaN_21800 [Haematococcus lacustris]